MNKPAAFATLIAVLRSFSQFKFHMLLILGLAVITFSFHAPDASAQERSNSAGQRASTVLEEIVVTARKREELLTDVPISIAAVSGDAVRSQGIQNLEYLSQTIPNLLVSENTTVDIVGIRGIHSGQNYGFEQTVGQVVDGFFYGRSRLTRVPFLDLERVEVLRGPQGALIGKNTTAGAINITTAKPTDEFEAWGQVSYESFEDAGEGITFEGAVSGPLTDSLKGRVALRVENGGGWVENRAINEDVPDKDDWVGRVSLSWDVNEDVNAMLQWTHNDQDREGQSKQLAFCSQNIINFLTAQNLPFSCGAPDKVSFNRAPINGQGNFETFTTELDIVGLTINWDIGGHTLTSLTGFATYDGDDRTEGDRTQLEVLSSRFIENYEQWSQELRWASPTGGQFDYIAGFYYTHRQNDSRFGLDTNLPPLFPGGMIPFPFPVPAVFPAPSFSQNSITAEEGDTYAVFGELTWNLNEQWSLTVDGRYTKENKEASQNSFYGQIHTEVPLTGVVIPPVLQGFPFFIPPFTSTIHTIAADRSESNFSPGFVARWKPDDDTMFYGSVRRGFKGGGFNHGNLDPQNLIGGNFEYNEEEVTAYEIGTKLTLADGAAQVNFSLYRMEFDDLQSTFVQISGTQILLRTTNAATATSQGFELDGIWQATENLRLAAALAYNSAEFEKYEGHSCYTGQTPAQGCSAGPDNIPGNNDDSQSLSGKQIENSPEWSGSINGEYRWSLTNDMSVTLFAQGVFRDEYFTLAPQDPQTLQDAWWKFDARLTLAAADDRWRVSLIGRNLTDELTSAVIQPIAPIIERPPRTYNAFVDPGRSLILQAQVRF